MHFPDVHLPGVDTAKRVLHEVAEHLPHPIRNHRPYQPTAVAVGSSTGGPDALTELLEAVQAPLSVPMFVVQHMPPRFTHDLARRLNRKVSTNVVEAEHGMEATSGTCYIAPGGKHMEVERQDSGEVTIAIHDDEPVNSCRPSVEPLFESAVNAYGRKLLAVMLTGMGRDGSAASKRIAELGCGLIAQDEESSVVWGMPRAVVERGYASEVLALDKIGPRLAHLTKPGLFHRH